ncbi:hypothetical protein BKA70DRAFT_398043 [Coprinopsis sp. MPI-PUGE-AT-0042]|nr:hypothetical protein BKA70DRAFT_398043 [Coprinopsis sp. MPI-PUGE-AT-0042]
MSKTIEELLDVGRRGLRLSPEMRSVVLQSVQYTKEQGMEALEQIRQTKRHLRSLEAKRRKLEHQAQQLTQLLAGPIMHLPVELLSYIFTLACEGEYIRLHLGDDKGDKTRPEEHDGETARDYDSPDGGERSDVGCLPDEADNVGPHRSTALVLTEVCSHWRATAIALDSLWARLDFDVRDLDHIWKDLLSNDSDYEDCSDGEGEEIHKDPANLAKEAARQREASFYAFVQTVFKRSRQSCALDIKLLRPLSGPNKYDGFASALETVVLHSGRIERLHCENLTFGFLHNDMDFPILLELHLTNIDHRLLPHLQLSLHPGSHDSSSSIHTTIWINLSLAT